MKKQECQKILKSNDFSFMPVYKNERIQYTNGKTYRTRRPKYVGLDE